MGHPGFPSGRGLPRKPPRAVIADDYAGMLAETKSLLEPEFQIVAAAGDGKTLIAAVLANRPDIVITDIEMPLLNGLDAGCEIVRRGLCSAVVVLSVYNDSQFVRRALDCGIRGYILKEDAGEELIPALWCVLEGGQYLSRGAKSA